MFDRPQTLAEAETRIRQTATVEELLGLFAKCAEVMLLDLSTDEFLEAYDKAAKIKGVIEDPKAPAHSKLEAYRAYEFLHADIRREVFPDELEYDEKEIISQARKTLSASGFLLRGVISDELYETEKAVIADAIILDKIEKARVKALDDARMSDDEYYELRYKLDLMKDRRRDDPSLYDANAELELHNLIEEHKKQHQLNGEKNWKDNLTEEQKDCLANSEKRKVRFAELKQEWLNNVKKNLLEESPVSEEEARQWVEQSVFIPQNLSTALAKQGNYPLEVFKADCAEFYRLMGGKMGMVEFNRDSKKDRAFQRGDIEVFMNGTIDKRTLFHELSHVVEANSGFSGPCSKDFVLSRATTDKPVQLKVLCPNRKYEDYEVAYPDHFISPYVGKVYIGDATEVLSVGLEKLASANEFYDFVMCDGEHCNYVLGVCAAREQFGRKRFEYTEEELAAKSAEAHNKQLKLHFDSERRRIGYKAITDKLTSSRYGLIDNHGIADAGKGYVIYEKTESGSFCRVSSRENLHVAKLAMYLFAVRGKIEALREKTAWDIWEVAKGISKKRFPSWFTENTALPSLDL